VVDTSKNGYTVVFLAITTIVAALVLSIASEQLKVKQAVNKKFDQKKIVMKAMGFKIDDGAKPADIDAIYKKSVERIFVTPMGKIVSVKDADKYNFEKTLKPVGLHKAPVDMANLSDAAKSVPMPVFIRKDEKGLPLNYTFPVTGKGLWSTLYGYISLNAKDLNTIEGAIFYDTGETPGLGKEIEADWFCKNFVGKKILNAEGKFVSVSVNKGVVNPSDKMFEHKVDGVSGATLTCNGVTDLLNKDFHLYEAYLNSLRGGKK